MAQTLFVGPHCLLVEGPSDLIYLQLISQACEEAGLNTLDPRWVVTPVGGADKVSTFVSLLGANQINVAVLIDANPRHQQRIKAPQDNGHLDAKALIQVSDFVTGKEPTLKTCLIRRSTACSCQVPIPRLFRRAIKPGDVKSKHPRLLTRLEQPFKNNNIASGSFSQLRPSTYFLREQVALLPTVDMATLERFDAIFQRVNDWLSGET
jgi:hypothetical protein